MMLTVHPSRYRFAARLNSAAWGVVARSLLFVGLLALSGCSGTDWTAFVFPDIQNIPNSEEVQNYTIGTYRTFEECQEASIDRIRSTYAATNRQGDYECGYKCSRRDDLGGMVICKETRK